jgi:hypothetical protein
MIGPDAGFTMPGSLADLIQLGYCRYCPGFIRKRD